jgi:DNA-binding NarL/FixJ family response regulator
VTFSILVVDDDDAFRGLASRLIASMRLGQVAEADTFATGLAAAVELRPRAMLVDVGLPDGDGVTLAAQLSSLPWRPRVVLTSSDPDAVTAAGVARAGAVGFVPKENLAGGTLQAMLEGT